MVGSQISARQQVPERGEHRRRREARCTAERVEVRRGDRRGMPRREERRTAERRGAPRRETRRESSVLLSHMSLSGALFIERSAKCMEGKLYY